MTTVQPEVPLGGKFNTKQAAQALGISYNTLMRYVASGYIRPSMGRKRRFFTGAEIIRCWRTV